MKTFTTLTLILLTKISFGQVLFNNIYSKIDFDYGDAVIERFDGKYLIAGSSRSQFVTDYDINILLVDTLGNLIWDKYIGQSPRMEFTHSFIETNDSNYVIAGRLANSNPYLMKFDSADSMIWEKVYPGSIWTVGYSVGQTFNGNYFFVCQDSTTTLFTTDSAGDTLWTNRYYSAICHSVIQTSDSGFALAGNTNIITINQDIILIKTNSAGDTLWTKIFEGPGTDDATSVQQLSDNGYIIAGNFDNQIADVDWDTYLIRTNSIGDTIWTKRYPLGTAHYIRECNNNNGYILSTIKFVNGFPGPDEKYLIITKLDTLGNIQWSRQFDGYTYSLGSNVAQTSDGGFLLTGFISNGTSMADIILIKLDSIGNYVLSVPDISIAGFQKVLTFPVPASGELNFILDSNNSGKIKQVIFYDSIGHELLAINGLNDYQLKAEIGFFAEGLYFYSLKTNADENITGKFIVGE